MIKNQAIVDHPGNRVADTQALLTRPRYVQYREKQNSNCGGLFNSGNCGGDTMWTPTNGQWWTWAGVGGTSGNRTISITTNGIYNPSYDFVGGRTTVDTPVSNPSQRIYGSYTLVSSTLDQDIYERTWWNCNCGDSNSGAVNCYNNCNCNCNCNCDCTCTCCFPQDTVVLLADGTRKKLSEVTENDVVLSVFGVENRVLGRLLCTVKAGDPVYVVNGAIAMTGEHILWGLNRWIAVDLPTYTSWIEKKRESEPSVGVDPSLVTQMTLGDTVFFEGSAIVVTSFEVISYEEDVEFSTLLLSGDKTFVANGYGVESQIHTGKGRQ